MTTNDLKQKLGENTEKVEQKIGELWTEHNHYYFDLEPWQRGLILLALVLLMIFVIYWLTKPDKSLSAKKEAQMEEKMFRQMAFFKKLRE